MATKYRAYIVEPRIELPQGFDPTTRLKEQATTLQEITASANELAKQAGALMELTEGFRI